MNIRFSRFVSAGLLATFIPLVSYGSSLKDPVEDGFNVPSKATSTSSSKINLFSRLPDEVVLKVLKNLSLSDLMNLAKTDQRLHGVSQDFLIGLMHFNALSPGDVLSAYLSEKKI